MRRPSPVRVAVTTATITMTDTPTEIGDDAPWITDYATPWIDFMAILAWLGSSKTESELPDPALHLDNFAAAARRAARQGVSYRALSDPLIHVAQTTARELCASAARDIAELEADPSVVDTRLRVALLASRRWWAEMSNALDEAYYAEGIDLPWSRRDELTAMLDEDTAP